MKSGASPGGIHRLQDWAQVQFQRFGWVPHALLLQEIHPADDLFDLSETKLSQDATHVLGQEGEEVHHHLRSAGELRAKLRLLRGYSHRTRIQMTLTCHNAACGHDYCSPEAKLFSAQEGRHDDISGRSQPPISSQDHSLP